MQQEGEPSVEEILESIKSVIARDNRESAKVEKRRRESETVAAPVADPVAAPIIADTPITDMPIAEDDILDLDAIMSDLAEEAEVEAITPAITEEGLTTQDSTAAMRESLAALAALSGPSAQPQIVRSGETSLEGLVRDMLRPMLAQWLETNLPQIVDNHVKAEIARIAGKKG